MNQDNIIDKNKVEEVKSKMINDDELIDLAELFKIFGDSTRMKIICCLTNSELCVSDISAITNTSQSAISHQLRILKQAKLIKARKEGKIVYYSLLDEHVIKIFKLGCEHIEEI